MVIKKVGVYKITNTVNGNYYIGGSSHIDKRLTQHLNYLKRSIHHCKALQEEYNQFGKDVFLHEIIEICDVDVLISREQYYMDTLPKEGRLNTMNHANSLQGSVHGMFGRTHDEGSRDEIKRARSLQVIKHSVETRQKIGAGNKGRVPSKESVDKMKDTKRRKREEYLRLNPPPIIEINMRCAKNQSIERLDEIKQYFNSGKTIGETAKKFNLGWNVTQRIIES